MSKYSVVEFIQTMSRDELDRLQEQSPEGFAEIKGRLFRRPSDGADSYGVATEASVDRLKRCQAIGKRLSDILDDDDSDFMVDSMDGNHVGLTAWGDCEIRIRMRRRRS